MSVGWPVRLPALFLALVALAAGSAFAAGPDLARGRQTYKELCAKCHGATGKGDGRESGTLKTKPKDFTDCERMAKIDDATRFKVVKGGGKASGLSKDMPSYSEALEDDEIQDVLAFVRTMCPQ
jgi:cytochrome c oxidase cbb3-type subunit 3